VAALTVGFDLDMTLIDSRPGIAAVWNALSAETGVAIDVDAATSRLGPPLADELARWFPADLLEVQADRFRELYPDLAIEPTPPMPGAHDALAAVHAVGGRAVVITGKYEANALLHVAHLGLEADQVFGWCWGEGKTTALRREGAAVYVGDHLEDMKSAAAAGAVAVGVLTGGASTADLTAAGADVVFDDLTSFPGWLAGLSANSLGSMALDGYAGTPFGEQPSPDPKP
jgi:phosphoglycolate phosphatase